MKYLVAVSGGIDSVVLLDTLAGQKDCELIVAHFDHGIRPDSADDARFVEALAAKYGVPFVTKREELGANASEDLARSRRYLFLRTQAKRYDAVTATAHHRDDVIESIAINLLRGTGWRGLAVLDAPDVVRPLIHVSKQYIRAYAMTRRLEWCEDSTNGTTKYLRNRVRAKLNPALTDYDKYTLFELWRRQTKVKAAVDYQAGLLVQANGDYSRYFFAMIDNGSARELLRAAVAAQTRWSPTRPQLDQALIAIKTLRPGAVYELGAGVMLHFTPTTFIVA